MTTWTPKTENSNSWTEETFQNSVFSRARFNNAYVFSHALFGGKKIFAVGTLEGLWDSEAAPATTWTAE